MLYGCEQKNSYDKSNTTNFNTIEVLKLVDLAFNNTPNTYYPSINKNDVKYNFFLDLEHGYFETAGSLIHLFADDSRWAIVFEKSGYQNRNYNGAIQLDYIGNCTNYSIEKYLGRNYISNSTSVTLIKTSEFKRIENRDGNKNEKIELIDSKTKFVKVRDTKVPFNSSINDYEKLGIQIRKDDNSENLIGFNDYIRYLHETNPELIRATHKEISKLIPDTLPHLMTIDKFHFNSTYDKSVLPSQREIYKLIAKVLVSKDINQWKPTQKPNNHWSNWLSGHL